MGVFFNVLSCHIRINDFLNVLVRQPVLVFARFEFFGCVNKHDIGVLAAFLEDQHAGWNGGAIEEVGWQSDNGIKIVLLINSSKLVYPGTIFPNL